MVEWAALEKRYARKSIGGSNPPASASWKMFLSREAERQKRAFRILIFRNMKYFIYTRKSTDSEERQVLSLESQLSELKEFAAKE